MAAGFAFGTCYALGDGFRIDIILLTAVLTANLHNSCLGRRRCLSRPGRRRLGRTLRQWDRISTGFAFGAGNSGWDLVRVHSVDFFTF